MSHHAKGPFEVKLSPQIPGPLPAESAVGRMLLDKVFHGDLEATSAGQMIALQGLVEGSAGYVALERVTGTLRGRVGSFALMHTGVMDRGTPSLAIRVVPDTGTDELTGISGHMNIVIVNGDHTYEFAYTLPTV